MFYPFVQMSTNSVQMENEDGIIAMD